MVKLSAEDQKLIAQKERYIATMTEELTLYKEGDYHNRVLASIAQAQEFIQRIHETAKVQAEITSLVGENASSIDRSMAGLYLWMKAELQAELLPKKRTAKKLTRNQKITNAVEALMCVQDESERMEKIMELPEDIQDEVFQIFACPPDRDGR